MEVQTTIIVVVIGLIALLTFCIIGFYNRIISSKNIVNDKWKEIDNQLDSKVKLLSKLIDLFREFDMQVDVNELMEIKNKLVNSLSIGDKIINNKKLDMMLERFNGKIYKKVNDDDRYKKIITSLKEADDKIDYAKEFYNEAVIKHNNLLKKFPFNLISMIFSFKTYVLFE